MRRSAATIGLILALAGCAAQEATHEDAFNLQIEAGRLEAFDGRINAALGLIPAGAAPEGDSRGQALQHASASVRTAWLGFLDLKTRACLEGKLVAQSCAAIAPPAWLGEAPDAPVAPAELRRRIEALQQAMGPLLQAACDAGRKLDRGETPELFCSVE